MFAVSAFGESVKVLLKPGWRLLGVSKAGTGVTPGGPVTSPADG